MEKQVLEFELEKETPGTYRFREQTEDGKPPAVKTIYVAKWAIGKKAPTRLKVTIEEA